ncbi:hypothetical protein HNP40_002774 [Mycobacteroides chelonae]|nr:hypothetical protein [Mycobacteroides chelonae]
MSLRRTIEVSHHKQHRKLFINYLTGADSFRFAHAPHFVPNDRAPSDTCLLGDVADPLVWITRQLCTQVSALLVALRLKG